MQLVPEKLREPLLHFRFSLFETESLRTFFETFKLKSYILLLLSPIGIAASAYLIELAFGAGSLGIGIGLVLLSLLLLLPWTLVPISFLFTTFKAKKWQRILSWTYVGLLIGSYIFWIIYL